MNKTIGIPEVTRFSCVDNEGWITSVSDGDYVRYEDYLTMHTALLAAEKVISQSDIHSDNNVEHYENRIAELNQHYLNACKVSDHEAERATGLETEMQDAKKRLASMVSSWTPPNIHIDMLSKARYEAIRVTAAGCMDIVGRFNQWGDLESVNDAIRAKYLGDANSGKSKLAKSPQDQ